MKRAFVVALGAFVALAAVLAIRASRFQLPPEPEVRADSIAVDDSAAADHLARAVRYRTVSYLDSGVAAAPMLGLHAFLDSAFPHVRASLHREVVSGYSLLYTWPGTDSTAAPIILMSHLDVVPVEPGTDKEWSHSPFSGAIADGAVWGRGTLDDKVGVLAILEAADGLLAQGYKPRRTLYFAFGQDEEVRGSGARALAKLLEQRGVHPEFVLDEGGTIARGLVPNVDRPVAMVGVAEKGYASVVLTAHAKGGHSSMPPAHTAVGELAAAVVRVESNPMPARVAGPTAIMFDRLGRAMPFGERLLFANRWLFDPLLVKGLTSAPTTNAAVRTTTAATMFEGSVKDNVLPQRARAVVNFRILPGDSVAGVVAHVRQAVADPHIVVSVDTSSASEPSPVSPWNSPGYGVIATTIAQRFPGALVTPFLMVGATDSRYYAQLTPNIYRFLPIPFVPTDLSRIHGTDERVPVHDYGNAVRFMAQLMLNGSR